MLQSDVEWVIMKIYCENNILLAAVASGLAVSGLVFFDEANCGACIDVHMAASSCSSSTPSTGGRADQEKLPVGESTRNEQGE